MFMMEVSRFDCDCDEYVHFDIATRSEKFLNVYAST